MDEPDLTTPGGRLRYARQLRDLTQTDLGDLVSIDRQSVYRHEAKGEISKKAAAKYAEVLGISEGWLLYRDGPDPGVRVSEALEAFFEADVGRRTPPEIRDLMRRVSYSALGITRPDTESLLRVRDLIVLNRHLEAQRMHVAGSAA